MVGPGGQVCGGEEEHGQVGHGGAQDSALPVGQDYLGCGGVVVEGLTDFSLTRMLSMEGLPWVRQTRGGPARRLL